MTITSNTIQILLVDDHAVVREGYRSLLQKQDNMTVVAEATNGNEAYAEYKQHQPDVVIMDISMPKQGGLEAITRIKLIDNNAKIVVFSMHLNPSFAIQATKAGALGYVTKSSDPDVLIRAIHDVYQNKLSLSPDIAQALALEKMGNDNTLIEELTVREFEILRLLVEAKTNQDIAEALSISPKTVANSHYIIKRKLNVNSDIELTRLAIKMNLVNLLDIVESTDNFPPSKA
jgi:two-component system invasion response regulator UvrY